MIINFQARFAQLGPFQQIYVQAALKSRKDAYSKIDDPDLWLLEIDSLHFELIREAEAMTAQEAKAAIKDLRPRRFHVEALRWDSPLTVAIHRETQCKKLKTQNLSVTT